MSGIRGDQGIVFMDQGSTEPCGASGVYIKDESHTRRSNELSYFLVVEYTIIHHRTIYRNRPPTLTLNAPIITAADDTFLRHLSQFSTKIR